MAPYAFLSLGAFVCALVILTLYLSKADRLVALGLSGNLYYIVLLPLGIFVGLVLFGVLRTYGFYRGKLFGGVLELGGPAVVFFLVLVLGFRLPPPTTKFTVTVYVHGSAGRHDLTLRNNGSVLIDTGGLRRAAAIDANGQSIFTEIPANFRGQEVTVGLDADGYEPVNTNEKAKLNGQPIYLEIRRKAGRIAGHVEDSAGKALDGVTITVAGITASTKPDGSFEVTIPGDRVEPALILRAVAAGYTAWADTVVPNSNDISITLHKK